MSDTPKSPAVSRRDLGLLAAGAATVAAMLPVGAQAQDGRREALTEGDWMAQVHAQHGAIDGLFRRIEGGDRDDRDRAFQRLKVVLSAHSFAEDAVIYPGLAAHGDRPTAKHLYDQQDDAKILVAELDNMPGRFGPEWMERFHRLASAVRAHAGEEESRDFPELMQRAGPEMNGKMSEEFRRHFLKYSA